MQKALSTAKNYLNLPSLSFNKKFFKSHFTINNITKGFFIAFSLSIFIYLAYFQIQIKILNTLIALTAFYFLLKAHFTTYFSIGFFIAIFWFNWIIISLIYYDLTYLMPIELFIIAFSYALIFLLIGLIQNIYIRAIIFLFISHIHPLGLNWFVPELTLLDTYFGITKIEFAIFLLAIILFIKLKKYYKTLSLIPLTALVIFQTQVPSPLSNPLNIYLSQSKIPQEVRWDEQWIYKIVEFQFTEIDKAIKNKDDIVVLTESAFPLILNNEGLLIQRLKLLSKKITIVLGSIYKADDGYYNANYYFIDGDYQVARKVFLVPFGEEIPFPQFLTDLINEIFYNGANDYKKAESFFDIEIKGVKFRNAICFEATVDELYHDAPDYIIASSNNGWFKPSIEPTLQNLLIRFYAKKYNKIIYHSANMGVDLD